MIQFSLAHIDSIVEEMRDACVLGRWSNKCDAIRIVRRGLDLSLKPAKEYVDAFWPDRLVNKFRDDMLRVNGFSDQVEKMIYENTSFRLELKDHTATYEDLMRFLDVAWEEMHKQK